MSLARVKVNVNVKELSVFTFVIEYVPRLIRRTDCRFSLAPSTALRRNIRDIDWSPCQYRSHKPQPAFVVL
jgi:hypothetical protein